MRRDELAEFLRLRRGRTSPESVGLPANGRRRTPGLRREEISALAGVGLSWYTWLEQGRDITPSAGVLDALARVLDLDAAEHAHLFHLAGVAVPAPSGAYPTRAPDELRDIVAGLVPNPAYLIGPRTDVLAWNPAAARHRNAVNRTRRRRERALVDVHRPRDPRAEVGRHRALHPCALPRRARPQLRRSGLYHAHRRLLESSAAFRELWRRHEVLEAQLGLKRLDHPQLGPLALHHLQSIPTSHPDLRLTQFVPADARTREALSRRRSPPRARRC